jgi:hypothetical protein
MLILSNIVIDNVNSESADSQYQDLMNYKFEEDLRIEAYANSHQPLPSV